MRIAFAAPVGLGALAEHVEVNRPVPSHASSWIMTLAAELGGRPGIELDVVTCTPLVASDQTAVVDGVKFHVLSTQVPGVRRGLGLAGAHGAFAWPTRRLISRVRQLAPDLVHGHGTEGPFSLAAVLAGRPHVVSMQGIMAKIATTEPTTSNRIAARTESFTLRRARHVHAKSEFSCRFLSEIAYDGVVHHIEPAIRAGFFSPGAPAPRARLVSVGALIKRKGVEDLISTLQALVRTGHDITMDLVGSGTAVYESHLCDLVAAAGLGERVRFLGELDPAAVRTMLREGGIFVLASHVENSPNSIMEAMAVGLPVVATDVGSVSNIVADGDTGSIVAAHDPAALAAKLDTMILAPDECAKMGARGHTVARERWQPSFIGDQMVAMYDDVMGDQRP